MTFDLILIAVTWMAAGVAWGAALFQRRTLRLHREAMREINERWETRNE